MTDLPPPHTGDPAAGPTGRIPISRRLRNYFFTGVVIAGPVAITLYIAWWLIGVVDNFVKPLIPPQYNPDNYLPIHVPGYGVLIAAIVIVLIGFLTANLAGRSLVQFGERILHRVPMVSPLYKALKQIFETVVSQSASNFKEVGLIEYPRKGLYAVVFLSTTAKGELADKVAGDDIVSVFLPTTPNPTSGYLLYLPRKDIQILDMSVEDGAKLIISAGLVSPTYEAKAPGLIEDIKEAAEAKEHDKPAPRTRARKSQEKAAS